MWKHEFQMTASQTTIVCLMNSVRRSQLASITRLRNQAVKQHNGQNMTRVPSRLPTDVAELELCLSLLAPDPSISVSLSFLHDPMRQ